MRLRTLLLISTALIPLGAPALAGPQGGQVVGGSATIAGQGSANVIVNQQSDKAVINWRMFDIGVGEKATFNQPNSNSVVLNRVTGGMGPSQILGTLEANGRVFVVNRDGIFFGAGAVVNTAGFLATTSDIRNEDFMAGRFNFTIPGRPDASIVNQGTITATTGGFAALVAPGVRNSGTITANLGSVALGAGNLFTLDFYGDKLITLGVGDQIAGHVKDVATGQTLSSLVKNEGALRANGGRVELTAAAARQVVDSVINTTGIIEANSVGVRNGQIVLSAATADTKGDTPRQTVRVSGALSAAGQTKGTKGGKIIVTGENIELRGAQIDASGRSGGGTVMIGGDWGGGKPTLGLTNNQSAALDGKPVANASTVSVDAASTIDASARDAGNGGKVILWSELKTSFAGTIYALGGRELGNGGFVETSSHGQLSFVGDVSTRAPNGSAGTLLLDPTDYYIVATAGSAPTGASEITNTALQTQLASNNVTLTTLAAAQPGQNGDIFLNAPVVWNASTTLTLSAIRNVTITYVGGATGAIRNTGGGSLIIRADNAGAGNGGTIVLNPGTDSNRIDWSGSTGKVSFYYNPPSYTSPTNFTTLNGHVTTNVSVPNQFTAYMLVNSFLDLQNINSNTSGSYALGKDFSASGYTTIGSAFGGVLTGNGGIGSNHTITNLNAQLFPTITSGGVVRDINFDAVSISSAGTTRTGTVAGINFGTISNVNVLSGTVTSSHANEHVGGVVGSNSGMLDHTTANVTVTGAQGNTVGGIAGSNSGTVANATFTGDVSANATNVTIGGLVGFNANTGTITDGLASGGTLTVGAFNGISAGGLVGRNTGSITNAQTEMNVTVGASTTSTQENNVGGLVGTNLGSIYASTASGDVSGGAHSNIGGLVGRNETAATITLGIASGNVTVSDGTGITAGGLVGFNFGTIDQSAAGGNVVGGNSGDVFQAGAYGGVVGINDQSGLITTTFGTGNVTVGLNNSAGGFVGYNNGAISGSGAGGDVTSQNNFAGGFAGFNSGAIDTSVAAGNVTGGGYGVGGFVGANAFGATITGSSAVGDVHALTGPNNFDNTIGGFAGENSGTITGSSAFGNVLGLYSAGGFAGDNNGTINNSIAFGNVSVANGGTAGGFASSNSGDILNSTAHGDVSGLGNNYLGGFVAGNFGFIDNGLATGNVSSTGANTVAGGFAGVTFEAINNSTALGDVNGTSNSYLGGFIGINVAKITDSTSAGDVSGSGSNNFVGGFAGMNFGNIDPSTSSGNASSGANSVVGGFIGANGALSFPNGYQLIGTNTADSTGSGTATGGPGSTVGQQVGFSYPLTGAPDLPANSCDNQGGSTICGGTLFNPNPGHDQDHQGDTPPVVSPLLNIAATLVGQTLTEKKQDDVVPAPPSNAPGSPSGQKGGNNQGNAGNVGRPPVSFVPPAGLGPLPSGMPPLNETRFASNEVVMQLGLVLTPEQIEALQREYGLEVISQQAFGLLGRTVYRFRITGGRSVRDVIGGIQNKIGARISVQPSYGFVLTQAGAAPAASQGDAAQYIVAKLGLIEAHRLATGKNIKIAVIDSEIDGQHPDLAGVIAGSYDALPSDDQTPHPHGTGMAGAIGSHQRLLGTAPGARILGVRAFGVSSNGAQGTSMNIVKGLEWAVAQGAQIINMSFAGPRDPILEQAIKALREKGIILIAAAGNAGPKSPPLFPAADKNVIGVSATDQDDKTYKGANRGPQVAIAAPGVDILVPAPEGGYQLTTGTSVAAAHVSGVVALMLERNPRLSPNEVRAILSATAKKLPQGKNEIGAGLIDPVEALAKSGPKQAQAQ